MTHKLWGGRFAEEPSSLLRALNDSFGFDRELFAEDVEGSVAWAHALAAAGVLTNEEAETICGALANLGPSFDRDAEDVHSHVEDVHSYVESKLYEAIGPLAGKLHTGRSRNDQVATDLKLWLKRACAEGEQLAANVARALAARAVNEAATPMPGYTHSKQAEPITFGHWCLAYVEMLGRDRSRFRDAVARNDECPLGSGALAGTPLAIDRDALAKSLGFARATRNSLDGVADRDLAVEYLFNATMLTQHLSRLAEDLIFFTSDEAGYAELPDALATGSSRMPQKKNPDVLELVRGYAARTIGELTGLLALMKALPLAYDKDLQLDKEPLFRTRVVLARTLPALAALIERLQLNRDAMREAASSDALIATAVADAIATTGIPFREAHDSVSANLANIDALARRHGVTLESILAAKSAIGGTAPERVREAASLALATIPETPRP
ncbi:MAG: argininosuccinate lyase [Acidobacteria bacterium]|nr:argininosuccinate lyase [Acidobacteriota bacterium]